MAMGEGGEQRADPPPKASRATKQDGPPRCRPFFKRVERVGVKELRLAEWMGSRERGRAKGARFCSGADWASGHGRRAPLAGGRAGEARAGLRRCAVSGAVGASEGGPYGKRKAREAGWRERKSRARGGGPAFFPPARLVTRRVKAAPTIGRKRRPRARLPRLRSLALAWRHHRPA